MKQETTQKNEENHTIRRKQKRQIVFIMTDSTRWDMLGCYGNPDMKTPCLDEICREGIRFDRAYTMQPVCGPARSALFTGVSPHTCGVWSNEASLYDNMKTVGQRLRDNQIRTGYIGKWHLDGGDYFGLGICPDGWDPEYWYDMHCYLNELSDEDRAASRQSDTMERMDFPREKTFANRCSNRALDFIERYGDEDFFLTVSYDEPHGPSICPEPYASMYRDYEFPKGKNVWDTLEDKPEHQRIWAGDSVNLDRDALKLKAQYFFGCNSFVDDEIGRVISQVRKKAPDAVIIYTADHGDMMQSHCLHAKGPAAYDEIARIPLIIWGLSENNGVYSYPVSHLDMVPTILEYMGIPIPALLEGQTILKAAEGKKERINDHIFIEFGRYETDHDGFGGFQLMRAVFDGRYKLVLNLLSSDELYDMENDPEECKNLIGDPGFTEIRNKLHDVLLDRMNVTRDPFRGYYWRRRSWRTDTGPATWADSGYTRQRENEEYELRQYDYGTGFPMKKAQRLKD